MNDDGQVLPEMREEWQATLGWQPTPEQQQQFQQLYELILDGNRQLNLTRITDSVEFWEKHLWDSLSGVRGEWGVGSGESVGAIRELPVLGNGELGSYQVIDIGTGSGFPGIPVAIVCPDWTVTLLDSTRKKMAFLDTVLDVMGIQNAKTLVNRAEQVGQHPQHREVYDLALIRAVAAVSVCAEYALPLLKLGGVAVLYRGQWTPAEEQHLERSVSQLGGKLEKVDRFITPLSQGIRHCITLKKVKPTPAQFPRAVGIPVQKPL